MLSNIFLITVIFACFQFNFLTFIFSLTSLFEPEHLTGSQQKKFQLGSSLCEPSIFPKGVTPQKKFELRNNINCSRCVFKKYSSNVQHILFEFFFENGFLKNMIEGAK